MTGKTIPTMVRVNYLGRSASIILAGRARGVRFVVFGVAAASGHAPKPLRGGGNSPH